MNLYDQNVAQLALLTPHRKQRFLNFMEETFRIGWLFAVRNLSEERIEITPISLPHANEMLGVPTDDNRRSFRLIQLERVGVNFGVFRPADTMSRLEKSIFSAYEIQPPKSHALLKDRLAALSE